MSSSSRYSLVANNQCDNEIYLILSFHSTLRLFSGDVFRLCGLSIRESWSYTVFLSKVSLSVSFFSFSFLLEGTLELGVRLWVRPKTMFKYDCHAFVCLFCGVVYWNLPESNHHWGPLVHFITVRRHLFKLKQRPTVTDVPSWLIFIRIYRLLHLFVKFLVTLYHHSNNSGNTSGGGGGSSKIPCFLVFTTDLIKFTNRESGVGIPPYWSSGIPFVLFVRTSTGSVVLNGYVLWKNSKKKNSSNVDTFFFFEEKNLNQI